MVGERWTLYRSPGEALEWIPGLREGERAKVRQRGSCERTEGVAVLQEVTVEELEDEDGKWLVIWANRASNTHTAAAAAGGGSDD